MKKIRMWLQMLLVTLLALGLLHFNCFAQTIDPKVSKVKFSIDNIKIRTVEGSFNGMKGSVRFEPGNLGNSNFNVCIDASTIDTDNKKRDEHLKSEDFFSVEQYPQICIISDKTIKKGEDFELIGKLTMHGVTKEIVIPFTYSDNTFRGTFKLNRLDYKIGIDTGTFMVGDEVSIEIICFLN